MVNFSVGDFDKKASKVIVKIPFFSKAQSVVASVKNKTKTWIISMSTRSYIYHLSLNM